MVESGYAESHHRKEEKFPEVKTTPIEEINPVMSQIKKANRAVAEAMKKVTVEEMDEIQNDRNVIFFKIRMTKNEVSDLAGNNCIKNKNGKIVFAKDGRKRLRKKHIETIMDEENPWDKIRW